jgi:RHS repeat-associated protein
LDNADGTSPAIRSLGEGWFTGKPFVEGLGHTFLMRNYRAGLAKWQTADPMGYPDGWNQLTYCGNSSLIFVDFLGAFMVGYFDLNSGATPSLVISADDMIIGNQLVGGGNAEDSNGEFFCGIKSVSRDFGGVLIKLEVAINVIAQKHDAQFQTGQKSKFHEHDSTPNDSYTVNPVYEAIVAHERGHAEAFFQQWRTLFSATLRIYDIDNPSLTISEVEQIVLRAYEETWNIHVAYSGLFANEKTKAWFEGNPTWKKMPSETAKNGDTLYVWKKVE